MNFLEFVAMHESVRGTKRTKDDVRLKSVMRIRADIRRRLFWSRREPVIECHATLTIKLPET